ncbi:MAG: aminomethyl-transferring glycine dehydrogenase subunit GcvPA [Aquificaceae bacterium]|nr:aminomethyl-transferring glycine dehydrogenase subunit GcvPA [Aquificaceae bacterium]
MYIPHSEEETKSILNILGLKSVEELFSHIDPALLSKPELPKGKSEEELRRYFKEAGKLNKELVCFAGFGAYDRIIPSAIGQLLSRGEYLTAYTPYQPEASQGTLQAIFEYQTLICELTGMEVANAGLYDGGSALAEGVLVARAIRGRGRRVVLSEGVHPYYRKVVETYLLGYGDELVICPLGEKGQTDLERLEELIKDGETHALVLQYPNFLGFLEPLGEASELSKKYGAPLVISSDPIALSVLKPPGHFGADIVVGEGQSMGIPLNFGGPYAGFFATRMEHVRKMPGRLVGMAEDIEGRKAFTLVLQTREQHIRRERATSNICTNQNLMVLANLLYMVLLGKEGMREVAVQSLSKAMYLKKMLLELGFEEVYGGRHLWEFPLKHARGLDLYKKALRAGFLFGVPLEPFGYKDVLLLAVTEKRTKQEMDRLLDAIV